MREQRWSPAPPRYKDFTHDNAYFNLYTLP